MMKNSKKILSLLLAMIICLCPLQGALAYEGETTAVSIYETTTLPPAEPTTVPTNDETTTESTVQTTTLPSAEPTTVPSTEPTTEPTTEPKQDEPIGDTVARLYVCYITSSGHPLGHCWIYVENLTANPLTVGAYTVEPYGGVSVGLLCRGDGWGIYYNAEAYSQSAYGMSGHVYVCEELNSNEVAKVSGTILSYLNHWDPFFNCMYFAFKIWNRVSNRKLIPIIFPIIGKLQMLIYGHGYDLAMKPTTAQQVYRQNGIGGNAYIFLATGSSLKKV